MRINKRSRLVDVDGCTKGYYRVSPFMKEAKYNRPTEIIQSFFFLFIKFVIKNRICGRIETVPPFQWYVEDQHPEDVSIVLKHAGLNDGYWEGLSFTLSGECLPNDSNMTSSLALKSYSNWMDNLTKESQFVDLTVAWSVQQRFSKLKNDIGNLFPSFALNAPPIAMLIFNAIILVYSKMS